MRTIKTPPPVKPTAWGFTLVELLVVLAIVAVLAVLGLLKFSRFAEKGKKCRRWPSSGIFNWDWRCSRWITGSHRFRIPSNGSAMTRFMEIPTRSTAMASWSPPSSVRAIADGVIAHGLTKIRGMGVCPSWNRHFPRPVNSAASPGKVSLLNAIETSRSAAAS